MSTESCPPTRLELELAATASLSEVHTLALAELLAQHRENVLRPFIELQRDFEALGDVRVVARLEELIGMTRGVP